MKVELSCFVNRYGQFSEVFLEQLFSGLSKNAAIEVISFSETDVLSTEKLMIRRSPAYTSIGFIVRLPYLLFLLKAWNVRQAYRLYLIRNCRAPRVYFPFIGMTRDFAAVMHKTNKKLYTSVRGTDITVVPRQQPVVLEHYRQAAKYLTGVHFLSEELQEIAHGYGVSFSHEKVIYQGLDTSKFKFNHNAPTDRLRLITVGRLHFIKGLELLLLSCFYLKREGVDFTLTIIGDGEGLSGLRHLSHYLGLHDQVIFRGRMAHAEILSHYFSSNVYVHTHLVSGVSNTMLEALACNLRVVCFDSNLKRYTRSELAKVMTEVPVGDVMALKEKLVLISEKKDYGNDPTEVVECLAPFSVSKHIAEFATFFDMES
ncbi:MAG: glycosyltransferase [Cyclobacteriaceae bacterium]|nr:glycosyltransferase [Cyclobacteriaceae bacterium]